MTCREFVAFLMAYLDEDLPDAEHAEFGRHIDRCPDCVAYLRSYEETVRLGRVACEDPEGPVPEDAPEALVQAILAARAMGLRDRG